jgi:hypothetical protein
VGIKLKRLLTLFLLFIVYNEACASLNFNKNYTNSVDYIYDVDKIEVSSGIAKLKGTPVPLIGWWHFNETEGPTAFDSSGNNNNGTLSAVEGYNLQIFDSGKLNNAISNPGEFEAMAYVNYGNIAGFTSTDTFSIEGWVYQAAGYEFLSLAGQYDSVTQKGWYVYIQNGYLALTIVGDWGTNQWLQTYGIPQVPPIEWHHIAITYDGSGYTTGVNMYLDSVLMEQSIYMDGLGTYTSSNTANFCVGAIPEAAIGWIGKIDELALYNIVLAQSDIDYRYNSGDGTELLSFGYPNSRPSIQPITLSHAEDIISFDGFTEVLGAGNQGQVKYTLTNNATDWYYWDGSSWAVNADSYTCNTVIEINDHIADFLSTDYISYRAYLISTSTQAVELSSTTIFYSNAHSTILDAIASLQNTITLQLSTSTVNILDDIDISSNTLSGQIGTIVVDMTPVLNAINISSNTLIDAINLSSNTLAGDIAGIAVDLTPVINAISNSSNTLSIQISTSTNQLRNDISGITVDITPIAIQISTSTAHILANIDTSSTTLSSEISAITPVVDFTPVFNAINTSSNTLNNQINTSSNTIMAGIVAIDLSSITGAINTSSNTLAVLISTNSFMINGNINTSSHAIINHININNDILVDKNWDENITSSHSIFNSSGRILREIRKKEP